MNKVILVGNVSKKGDLIKTKNDVSVLNLGFATNERYRDSEGSIKQHADYHSVTLFGKHADSAEKHISVGTALVIEGHLSYSEYEREGQKHKKASIIVEKYEFVGAKKK